MANVSVANRETWFEWSSTTELTWTPSGNRQRPSYQALVNNVSARLGAINRRPLIQGAFRSCLFLSLSSIRIPQRAATGSIVSGSCQYQSRNHFSFLSRVVSDDATISVTHITELFDCTNTTPRLNRREINTQRQQQTK